MNGEYRTGDIVLGNWELVRLIGQGAYGKVYEAHREDFGTTYKAAIKIMTIPQSRSEVESALAEGMDEQSATAYFRSFVEDMVREFALMSRLKGTSYIVSYEDHTVSEHSEGIGWDILIRMELLTSLPAYMKEHPLTRNDVIRLGIDMCRALERCQRFNIIHRDIKPDNIFLSEAGNFKLGDFGVARTLDRTTSGLSKKGTYSYMAPEVYRDDPYGSTVDIYSLGIVLYRLLNNNRIPFLPQPPAQITYNDRERALQKRISGETLPVPVNADGRLAEIVLKACAFDPADRYGSPSQMRKELEAILLRPAEETLVYGENTELEYHSTGSNSGMHESSDDKTVVGNPKGIDRPVPEAPEADLSAVHSEDTGSDEMVYEQSDAGDETFYEQPDVGDETFYDPLESSKSGIASRIADPEPAAADPIEPEAAPETDLGEYKSHTGAAAVSSHDSGKSGKKALKWIALFGALTATVILLVVLFKQKTLPPASTPGQVSEEGTEPAELNDSLILSEVIPEDLPEIPAVTDSDDDAAAIAEEPEVTAEPEAEEPVTENWSWTLEDGVLTISGTGDMPDYSQSVRPPWFEQRDSITKLVIESGITSIGSWSFASCGKVSSVDLPESLSRIGEYAFNYTYAITSFEIPSGVSILEKCALYGMSYKVKYSTAKGNVYFTVVDNTVYNIDKTTLVHRPDKRGRSSFSIPKTVTTIADGAMQSNYSLLQIVIPKSVTYIGDDAFNGCVNIRTVEIPAQVTHIGDRVFSSCLSLTGITVAKDNEYYTSQNGILYSKDLKTLIRYPTEKRGETFTIPSGVTHIADGAFESCKLKSLTIPNSVEVISSGAFRYSTIGTLTYNGSVKDWFSLEKGEDNKALSEATLVFSES